MPYTSLPRALQPEPPLGLSIEQVQNIEKTEGETGCKQRYGTTLSRAADLARILARLPQGIVLWRSEELTWISSVATKASPGKKEGSRKAASRASLRACYLNRNLGIIPYPCRPPILEISLLVIDKSRKAETTEQRFFENKANSIEFSTGSKKYNIIHNRFKNINCILLLSFRKYPHP